MFTAWSWAAIGTWALHIIVVGGLSLRVISQRRPTGVSLAWLTILAAFPVIGVGLYVFVGETWLGGRRSRRTTLFSKMLREPVRTLGEQSGVTIQSGHHGAEAVAALGLNSGFSPPLGANALEVFSKADDVFQSLLRDIDNAQESCDLLYYIWSSAGRVSEVEDALIRASNRGVTCRVLVDAVGSNSFLKSGRAARLREASIQVRAALPVNILRGKFSRIDIRNHRKLASIDDTISHVGSMNMADPNHFKINSNVGQWVDLAARIEGPGAGMLSTLFELDWAMESQDKIDTTAWFPPVHKAGDTPLQIVPSGPGQSPQTLYRMLTTAVHGARERLTLTTPYFVPDDAFVSALVSAAMRGVDTTVIVPAKVDGVLVSLASHSYFDALLEAGVRVLQHEAGLLHAKTVTVDDAIGIIGTVNLDRRSFWLNYELSLIVHGGPAVADIRAAQSGYEKSSRLLADAPWMQRSPLRRFAEDTAQLLSPIL